MLWCLFLSVFNLRYQINCEKILRAVLDLIFYHLCLFYLKQITKVKLCVLMKLGLSTVTPYLNLLNAMLGFVCCFCI